jgi:hypothetical protein
MLAAVIQGRGTVVVRFPPGEVAQALAAGVRPEHLKIALDVAGS